VPAYRENAQELVAPPPTELVYLPNERRDQRSGCAFAFKVFAIPAGVCALLLRAAGIAVGVAAFAVLLAIAFGRAARDRPGKVLRLEGGELRVYARGQRVALWTSPLKDLVDVVLETKTIERVVEGGSTNLGMTYLNPRIAPPTDTNRIVLERRDGDRCLLSEEFHGHVDTVDWFARIRRFLRQSDWIPEAERDT
jgi:hypothetical protein